MSELMMERIKDNLTALKMKNTLTSSTTIWSGP